MIDSTVVKAHSSTEGYRYNLPEAIGRLFLDGQIEKILQSTINYSTKNEITSSALFQFILLFVNFLEKQAFFRGLECRLVKLWVVTDWMRLKVSF